MFAAHRGFWPMSVNVESIPDNPYAVASTDGPWRTRPSRCGLERISASRYSGITVFTCRFALGVTILCWAAIALFPMPNVDAFTLASCSRFPTHSLRLQPECSRDIGASHSFFMLTILALAGLRLFLAVSFACVVTQIDENDGDNMIGILLFIDLFFVVPVQLALTIACGGYAFWRNRKIKL